MAMIGQVRGLLNVGHRVMLMIPPDEPNIPGDMWKHNEECFDISKVRMVRGCKERSYIYYELKGLNSNWGVPFGVLPEWLYNIGVWTG